MKKKTPYEEILGAPLVTLQEITLNNHICDQWGRYDIEEWSTKYHFWGTWCRLLQSKTLLRTNIEFFFRKGCASLIFPLACAIGRQEVYLDKCRNFDRSMLPEIKTSFQKYSPNRGNLQGGTDEGIPSVTSVQTTNNVL